MEDLRVGQVFRAVRIRRRLRQQDVANAAGISRSEVSLVERGHLDGVPVRTLRRIGAALEIRIDVFPRWRGADLDRLMNAGHASLHEDVAGFLDGLVGWKHLPEVSFSIYGERGVIDILAFHPESGCLLIIELKTEIVDLEDLLATMHRRVRLAKTIAREHGWAPRFVGCWVIVAESDTNRRRLRAHRATLRSAFPADGHFMRAWLRKPNGGISALSFWADASGRSATQPLATRKRVRKPQTPVAA